MRYPRLKIVLLALGVVAGYGSAFAHFTHMRHGHGDHCDHYGFGSWRHDAHEHGHAPAAKPVQ